MDVFQLIKERRSIPRFKPDPVPRDVIEMMLEAATWAPNHHLTEPWEFYVLEGAAREGFAAIRRRFRRTLFPDPEAPAAQKAAAKIYQDTLATPVIIIVTTRVSADPAVNEDDYAATFCAIQNMLLVAASRGVGTYPRTGGLIYDPALRAFLNLSPERRVASVVYVGYPAVVPERRRTSHTEKTKWLREASAAESAPKTDSRAGPAARPRAATPVFKDPVCDMEVTEATAVARSEYQGETFYFCSLSCRDTFEANPAAYAARSP